jgi:hypothetical protein
MVSLVEDLRRVNIWARRVKIWAYMFSQQTQSVGFNLSAFEKYSSACAFRFAAL